LNLLADVPANERHLTASVSLPRSKTSGRILGDRVWNIFFTMQSSPCFDCPNTSLLGVNRLLTDSAYRRWVVDQIKDPFIREFWQAEYESYDTRFRREAIAPIQINSVSSFESGHRNILGQVKNKVDFPFVWTTNVFLSPTCPKARSAMKKQICLVR